MAELDVAQRILTLKADVAKAQKLRAEAEANLAVAKRQLTEVDAGLKKLGLDPEKADVELTALEAQLQTTVAELEAAVAQEIAEYNKIVQASKAVLA